jgi:hypothetical protein
VPHLLLLLLQDAELGGKGAVSGHHGYTAVDDDLLDPWADARSQLRSGSAEVGSTAGFKCLVNRGAERSCCMCWLLGGFE